MAVVARRILVVDDEEAIRVIVKASLEFTAGWTVLAAASAVDGLQIAQEERPDAVLIDVMMPEMGGVELLNRLRSHSLTADIPAIFLTAQVGVAEQETLELLGNGVILKPFEPMAIAQKISSILGWPD